ncbi:hypothetical protein Bca101_067862 [Brassica carinata]
MLQYHIDDHDRISKLPDVLLQMIVSKLSTEEALRTSVLSSRWVDVWKCMSHIVLDTRGVLDTTPEEHKHLHRLSVRLARSMTKVINDHRGHLESCIVHHYVFQLKNGTLQNWIHSLTRLKHTKDLALINYIPATRRYNEANFLSLLPDTFSHHSLSSLSLCGYTLIGPHAFNKCKNLKTLKLINIFISKASVLSGFLAAFPFLEVILLNVNFLTPHGVLKIEKNSLKFLQLSFPNNIDRMEVYATCLNVLDIDNRFINAMRDNFILVAPKIQVNKNAWLDQVIVDIIDPKEMEILKEVLLRYWTKLVMELEIFFKLYNFDGSKEEEFAFVSQGVSYLNIKEEKERLEEELHLAEEKWSAIKVPHVDWYKMGESWMAKP